MDDVLAHALVITSVILVLIQGVSALWSVKIARHMTGQPGATLAGLLALSSAALFVSHTLALIRAVLIEIVPETSMSTRVVIFLASQVLLTVVSVAVMFRARFLERSS